MALGLIAAGLPIFVARRAYTGGQRDWTGGTGGTGYWLPKEWQQTQPDPSTLDRYEPGDALCVVTGHGLDLLDFDPRNGGDATRAKLIAADHMPTILASASTPSGGRHDFVRSACRGRGDPPEAFWRFGQPTGLSLPSWDPAHRLTSGHCQVITTRLTGHLVALVRVGAEFKNGNLVERPDDTAQESGGDQQVA